MFTTAKLLVQHGIAGWLGESCGEEMAILSSPPALVYNWSGTCQSPGPHQGFLLEEGRGEQVESRELPTAGKGGLGSLHAGRAQSIWGWRGERLCVRNKTL